MKPIGYRDLHGPRGGAYVFRLEPKQIGGIALSAGAVAILLLLLGVLFARSGSSANPAAGVAGAAAPRQPIFTAVVTPAPSDRSEASEAQSEATPEGSEGAESSNGLAPSIATPSEAPASRPRPVAQTKPAPARTPSRPARPAAVRPTTSRPASARPAATRSSAVRTPSSRPAAAPTPWKPPTPYGFIVASFVVPTRAAGESAALLTARKRGEAQVAALQKRGLTRARLVENRTADRVTYRVLADERRYYDRDGAAERKADLRREYRFREVWVLPL